MKKHKGGKGPIQLTIGQRYGGWRVLAFEPNHGRVSRNRHYRVLCLSCLITITIAPASNIIRQHTACCQSCARTTHGQSYSLTYRRWIQMLRRTGVIGRWPSPGYAGVPVCRRWRVFPNFLADMLECPTKRHSLGRLDSSKGYSKRNCAWQTWPEQARCKANNVWFTVCGLRFLAEDLATLVGTHRANMRQRLRQYPALEAFARPLKMSSVSQGGRRTTSFCRPCGQYLSTSKFYVFQDRLRRIRYSWLCKACVRPVLRAHHVSIYGKGKV